MTDALGRKFWRFTGSSALIIANAPERAQHAADDGVCCLALRQGQNGHGLGAALTRYSAYTDETTNTSDQRIYFAGQRGNQHQRGGAA